MLYLEVIDYGKRLKGNGGGLCSTPKYEELERASMGGAEKKGLVPGHKQKPL